MRQSPVGPPVELVWTGPLVPILDGLRIRLACPQIPPRLALMERTMTEDERAIRDVVETWMRASRSGDTATVLSLMTQDVVFMVPGREPFGRDAFEAQMGAMSAAQIDGTSEIVELQVLGGWAFARSHIDLTITPPQGEPVRRSGYALSLFRKESDGRWRLARDANLLTVKS